MACLFIEKNKTAREFCNMQFPTSHTVYKAGNYANMGDCSDNKYYKCLENGNIIMKATGEHNRCEFRCIDEWSTNVEDYKIIKSIGRLDIGSQQLETTFVQIHDNPAKSGINKPLLRISWIKDYKGTKNHFWAVFKNSYDPNDGKYVHYDLGPYDYNFNEWKILVKDNVVSVKKNDVKLAEHDVTYYEDAVCYFKTGIYNQGDGHSEYELQDLWISVD